MSESVVRRRGRLNHRHVAERTRKLREDDTAAARDRECRDALSAAWKDFLAAERKRRGSPGWNL